MQLTAPTLYHRSRSTRSVTSQMPSCSPVTQSSDEARAYARIGATSVPG